MRKFIIGVGIIIIIVVVSWAAMNFIGNSEVRIPMTENDFRSASSGQNPEGWPEDAPTPYLAAPILYSHADNGFGAVYNVSAPREDVVAYYTTRLEEYGWTVTGASTLGNTFIIIAEKDGRRFDAYLIVADDITAVTTGILFDN